MKKNLLYLVLGAIVLGFIAGLFAGTTTEIGGIPLVRFFDFGGSLFLNALKLIVIPLVAASLITGAAKVGADHSIKSLGTKTFGAIACNLLIAIFIGFAVVTLVNPGEGFSLWSKESIDPALLSEFKQSAASNSFDKITEVFYHFIPSNIFQAASQGDLLGIIFFCMLFGFSLNSIDPQLSKLVLGFWKGVFEAMMRVTHFIMRALPIGVFCLVAAVASKSGIHSITSMGWFVFTVVTALSIYGLVALPLLLKFVAKVSPVAHFRAVAPALFTAFSTSSSAAALPTTLECLEERARVSNRVCSFVIPLGTSINLAASALYVCVAVFFIAEAYHVEMTVGTKGMVILMSFLMAFGMAGIPSGCLIVVLAILQTMGIPAEAVGLLWAVERLLDMYRTSLNVLGNTCCGVLVARLDGETRVLSSEAVADYVER